MSSIVFKKCEHCGTPYGVLPPIGAPKQIQLPTGEPIVPGTLSEKSARLDIPQPTPPQITTPNYLDLFSKPPGGAATLPPPPQLPTPPAPSRHQVGTMLGIPEALHTFGLEKQGQAKNQPNAPPTLAEPFDHALIGGRVTICVLLYGNFADMHKKCLNAIMSTVAPQRRQLRVACNEVGAATMAYVDKLQQQGAIHKVYVNATNAKKYPAMRQMFHDVEDPITDRWIIWFDDDSIANKDPQWATKLVNTIITTYQQGHRMFGRAMTFGLHPSQIKWIRSRPWYKGRAFQLRNGKESANGDKVLFPAGGFWALETQCMRDANIPDPQIGHNGGDYVIAEQLWQLGHKVKGWNNSKQFVAESSVKRRGLTEIHTGMPGWRPGGVSK